MKTFGYTRVSTSMQVDDGASLDVQRRQIEGYAMMHGFELAEVVVEEGVSGSVPIAERPEGGKLRPDEIRVLGLQPIASV
jgi:putative DNA-invertase from lambdoid prophage Rac